MPNISRAIVLAALTLMLAPVATAHVDLCYAEACVYEWDWSYGEGSCRGSDSVWWSHRVASAGAEVDGTDHGVQVETYCYAGPNSSGSSVHVGYVTRDASGEWTWVFVDWSGWQSGDASDCTIRYWGHNQGAFPDGTAQEPCPVAPPLLLRA